MIELVLEHSDGPLAGTQSRFDRSKLRITIGRDPQCDVAYPETLLSVAPEHLDLMRDAGHYELRVNSLDAVLVNGERAGDGWELADGDRVRLGADNGPGFVVRYANRVGTGAQRLSAGDHLPDDARALQRLHRTQRGLFAAMIALTAIALWGLWRARQAEEELREAVQQRPVSMEGNAGATTASFAHAIGAAAQGVYLVLSRNDVGESPLGTAWVVAPGQLATNAHVAEVFNELKKEDQGRSLIVRASVPPFRDVEVTGVHIHPAYEAFRKAWEAYAPTLIDDRGQVREMDFVPGYDVGLLLVDKDIDLGTPLARADTDSLSHLRAGAAVAYVGFPMENLIDVDYSQPNPSSQVANVVALATFTRTKPVAEEGQLLEHSLPVTGGASGSPIIDERGKVVAILSAENTVESPFAGRTPSAALVNYGQRIDVLQPLLDRSEVDLAPLREQWRNDLARYSSRQKVSDRIVKSALAQWVDRVGSSNEPEAILHKTVTIGADDHIGTTPGTPIKLKAEAGHYLVIGVSAAGRDVDAAVYTHGNEEGDDDKELGRDDANDHLPMVPFDLESPTDVRVDVLDPNFEVSEELQRSDVELTVYRLQ